MLAALIDMATSHTEGTAPSHFSKDGFGVPCHGNKSMAVQGQKRLLTIAGRAGSFGEADCSITESV